MHSWHGGKTTKKKAKLLEKRRRNYRYNNIATVKKKIGIEIPTLVHAFVINENKRKQSKAKV